MKKITFLLYYLIIAPILIAGYKVYLIKPESKTWDKVTDYLKTQSYQNETVVFKPTWLKNYAISDNRKKFFNADKKTSDYWLIELKSSTIKASPFSISNLTIIKVKAK